MKRQGTVLCMMAILFAVFMAGCSGGGSSGSSTSSTTSTGGGAGASGGSGVSLAVAEKVSVVDAQSSPGKVVPLKIGNLYLTTADIPAGSQYFTDPQNIFVHERSAEVFDTINEIMCAIAQTQYDEMVNKGDYKAQIDKKQCSSSNDSASSAGQSSQNQSSGSTAPDYETWTVNSYRADNNSPQIVVVWIHEEARSGGFEPEKRIFAKLTITESKSSTNPYGIFTVYFKSHPVMNGTVNSNVTMFKGFLKAEKDTSTGKVLLKFIVNGGFDGNQDGTNDFSFNETVTLDRNIDGSSGSGTSSISDTFKDPVSGNTGTKSAKFNIAFNTSNFRRQNANNTSDDKCFSRTTFDETAWRYGLYDSTGTRVDINSGFPIKKDSAYGWIGYYGLWFPENTTINNGDTVYKLTYSQSGETATPYTVVKKGGKLKKHTKHTATLDGIKNIPMDLWVCGQSGCTGYRVKWTAPGAGAGATTGFVTFARQNQTSYMWENITEAPLSLTGLDFGELNFWSQAIGGQVRVKLSCTWNQSTGKNDCQLIDVNGNGNYGDDSTVIYFTEEVVFPGATVPATLRCYDNCPQYDATNGVTTYTQSWDPSQAQYHDYTFNTASSAMVLQEGSNPLVLTSASGSNQWGFMSGPLFDPATPNLSTLLACDWNPSQICGWKAWGALDTYYTWETGPNQWNQFTALADSNGAPVTFSPPLQVKYTHTQTNQTKPDYKYNGTTFYLEYSGFGNLWGIPGKCVNGETGADIDCGAAVDDQLKRWIAEFTIPDGSELSNSATPATKYLAKALEKEQRMSNVAASNCSSLTLTDYTLPVITDWVDPNIGAEPTVNNAPAVIGGVVQ